MSGLKWKSKIVLLKAEASYGVDPGPAAANGMLMTNVEFRAMEGQDLSRDLEYPHMGGQELMPVGLHCVLTGRVELVPSGTAGVAPAWGLLMRIMGCAQSIVADTSVIYNPTSDQHESAYLYFWIGGTRHKVAGCRADGTLRFNAQGIPYLDNVRIVGLYAGVAEAARVSPSNFASFKRPRVVTKANTPTFTVNAVSLVMRSFALALRNQVEPRLLVGLEEVMIVDRADQISMVVQAVPLTTFDPYALALAEEAASLLPVELVHGTDAGFIATLEAPTCQLQRPSGFANAQGVTEWPLTLNPLPNSGNDQWTLTLT